MTGDNVTNDFEPLDFKKEGIVLDYKTAGVDIDAGNKFVEELIRKVPKVGGFGGMFNVPPYFKYNLLTCSLSRPASSIELYKH